MLVIEEAAVGGQVGELGSLEALLAPGDLRWVQPQALVENQGCSRSVKRRSKAALWAKTITAGATKLPTASRSSP